MGGSGETCWTLLQISQGRIRLFYMCGDKALANSMHHDRTGYLANPGPRT